MSRMTHALVGLAFALGVAALNPGAGAAAPQAAGAPSVRFDLPDTHGRRHTDADWVGARAVVLVFITPDCPVSQGYVPELNRIHGAYAARGVKVYGVQADLTATAAAVRQHVAEYDYQFTVLLDPDHVLVEGTDATMTPEAVVLTPAGHVMYQGRIDDRIPAIGVRRPRATAHELRDALDAVLTGRTVETPRTQPVGCFIVRPR